MAYSVDYGNDYAHVDGVEDATYTPPGGATVNGVKVRRGSISYTDLQSGVLSLVPGDVPWILWVGTLGAAALAKEAVLVVGSVSYTVVSWADRPDGEQARVFTRKRL